MTHRFALASRALLLGIALAGAAGTGFAQSISMSGFPGTIGSNIRKAFIESYAKGSNVKYVESWDSARFTQMQANRARPKEDVVTFTDLTLPLAASAGLLDPLDPTVVTFLSDVDPVVRTRSDIGVPFGYGCFGIAYNSKHVKAPITSWADLVREDLKGHVSAPNVAYTGAFNVLDGLSRTKGKDLLQPEAGMELYRQIRTSGPGLWDGENTAIGWLKTGEVWVTPFHSGNTLVLMQDPDLKDLRFIVPKEGAYYAPLAVAKVKNGPAGGVAAEQFINHVLSVQSQEAYAALNKVRPVNLKAKVPSDAAAACPTASALRRIDIDHLNRNRTKILDQWNQVVNR